ncbi:MAG: hypothetical protein J07AB43_01010 [Candidatus Nanosalina sp. J07AB43]|nr:MAG: hypothetical protein J07AB43_01010 [Candidatus Nanosalina sp. J07AB43]
MVKDEVADELMRFAESETIDTITTNIPFQICVNSSYNNNQLHVRVKLTGINVYQDEFTVNERWGYTIGLWRHMDGEKQLIKDIISKRALELVTQIKEQISTEYHVGSKKYDVCLHTGTATCRTCGREVKALPEDLAGLPELFSEMSIPNPKPATWDTLVSTTSRKYLPTIKFYLIGKVRANCACSHS